MVKNNFPTVATRLVTYTVITRRDTQMIFRYLSQSTLIVVVYKSESVRAIHVIIGPKSNYNGTNKMHSIEDGIQLTRSSLSLNWVKVEGDILET